MHINLQRSGGRGEYEVVGSHSGYSAIGLEGWTFLLKWPDGIVRETALELEPGDSGKPRLRSQLAQRFQIGRMIASMLLLPDPRRALRDTTDAYPIATYKGYVVSRVGFGPGSEFDGITDRVSVDPSFVNITNKVDTESIGVPQRWQRIEAVYGQSDELPYPVQLELDQHRAFMASGQLVDSALPRQVGALCRHLANQSTAGYRQIDDPLPELERMLGLEAPEGPSLPAPDELGEDEPEVSARAAQQYRLAKVRGIAQVRFSQDVRQAYGNRCAFCGGIYGGIPGIKSGLEAAHILAWSKYNLDVTNNGMSLCKTHHWAFDASLLVPEHVAGTYRLRFTELSRQFDEASMRLLGRDKMVIPDAWLPVDKAQRPSGRYLNRLYDDLAISFID